ncbi:hypothetical protein LJ707_10355 [Mucilaginibacter sp. UR6-1]|uniref:hypothetical protein n=1 Tax=Mucilaginibacter sp. UR6-1 TaxID=1435643 RepID=UPI001E45BF7F|nr:hypothetical protein [Mucilaginibacter sp. UR6-1]MCC8409334.1 hypothetical protein [Mucilaginibacter sp. UR6-1]
MGFFRKAKNKPASPLNQMVSSKVTTGYNTIKTKWAEWMASSTAGFTKKGWITALACLILLMGSNSGYLIISAFTGAPRVAIKVAAIQKPAHAGDMGEPELQANISPQEYLRIEKFHRYMDSLARDPTGRRIYDGITNKRPGLMDIVKQVEEYYQQFKNKEK